MSASMRSVELAYAVLWRHVRDERTMDLIVRELQEVPGNASFRDTIERLAATHAAERLNRKHRGAQLSALPDRGDLVQVLLRARDHSVGTTSRKIAEDEADAVIKLLSQNRGTR